MLSFFFFDCQRSMPNLSPTFLLDPRYCHKDGDFKFNREKDVGKIELISDQK